MFLMHATRNKQVSKHVKLGLHVTKWGLVTLTIDFCIDKYRKLLPLRDCYIEDLHETNSIDAYRAQIYRVNLENLPHLLLSCAWDTISSPIKMIFNLWTCEVSVDMWFNSAYTAVLLGVRQVAKLVCTKCMFWSWQKLSEIARATMWVLAIIQS